MIPINFSLAKERLAISPPYFKPSYYFVCGLILLLPSLDYVSYPVITLQPHTLLLLTLCGLS